MINIARSDGASVKLVSCLVNRTEILMDDMTAPLIGTIKHSSSCGARFAAKASDNGLSQADSSSNGETVGDRVAVGEVVGRDEGIRLGTAEGVVDGSPVGLLDEGKAVEGALDGSWEGARDNVGAIDGAM
jgi:hypothetical protein